MADIFIDEYVPIFWMKGNSFCFISIYIELFSFRPFFRYVRIVNFKFEANMKRIVILFEYFRIETNIFEAKRMVCECKHSCKKNIYTGGRSF